MIHVRTDKQPEKERRAPDLGTWSQSIAYENRYPQGEHAVTVVGRATFTLRRTCPFSPTTVLGLLCTRFRTWCSFD